MKLDIRIVRVNTFGERLIHLLQQSLRHTVRQGEVIVKKEEFTVEYDSGRVHQYFVVNS